MILRSVTLIAFSNSSVSNIVAGNHNSSAHSLIAVILKLSQATTCHHTVLSYFPEFSDFVLLLFCR